MWKLCPRTGIAITSQPNLPFSLSVCKLAPCQLACIFSELEKKKKNNRAMVSKQGMKVIFSAFQKFGIFIGYYCRRGPFNVIYREHTLFKSSFQNLQAQPCDRDLGAEGPRWKKKMFFSFWEIHTNNKRTGLLYKKRDAQLIINSCV